MKTQSRIIGSWYSAGVAFYSPPRKLTLPSLRSFGLALILCLAAGCSGIRPTLKPEVVATVTRTGVRNYLPQSEVKAEFIMSGYGAGGGLIGALIDAGVNSGRQSNAERRVQDLRTQVRNVDFRSLHRQALSNSVNGVSWLKADGIEDFLSPHLPPVTKKMVADRAVLNIGTDYYISQDCRVFVVSSGLGFFPPGKHGRPKAAVMVAYHSAQIGQPDAEQAIALWAADGAAPYRTTVAQAIQENSKLVNYALQYMGGAATPSSPLVKIRARLMHARGDFGIKAGMVKLQGNILEDNPDRIIFRAKTGQFYSLPRNEVEFK